MYILRISKDVKKFSGLTLLQTFIKCLVKFDGISVRANKCIRVG